MGRRPAAGSGQQDSIIESALAAMSPDELRSIGCPDGVWSICRRWTERLATGVALFRRYRGASACLSGDFRRQPTVPAIGV
jgi:hypothetical protein